MNDSTRATIGIPRAIPAITPDEIRAIRAGLGLSRMDFADALQMSFVAVKSWENGARRPSRAAERIIRQMVRPADDPEKQPP